MKLPPPVPELPVNEIEAAAKAYVGQMGFTVDWTYQDYLAGISRDDARIFLRRRTPQEKAKGYSILVWLNMSSPTEVDELHADWTGRGVMIVEELHTTPHKLRQFIAQDIDGNRVRVFFDLGTPAQQGSADEKL